MLQPTQQIDHGSQLLAPNAWGAVRSLCWREIVRFFRQPNRVIGAVGQPILFWLLFGVGMNRSFQVSGQRFSEYYIPGTLILIILFTAIFATISIIEDRKEGFLQCVLVAPIPRWSMVLGKVAGGSFIALFQSLLFLALALTLGVSVGVMQFIAIVALMLVVAVTLTCLGFVIAWRLDSTQGFHAIMNLLLMPMWLLSGAFFPVPVRQSDSSLMEIGLHWIMRINPVTYAVAGVRQLMFGLKQEFDTAAEQVVWMPPLTVCWIVSVGSCAVMFVAAWRVAGCRTRGDLI